MLNRAVKGSTQIVQRISWPGQVFSGATITGVLIGAGGVERAITGTLVAVSGETGLFDWTYSDADVAEAGYFFVQFTANYGSGVLGKTLRTTWKVEA